MVNVGKYIIYGFYVFWIKGFSCWDLNASTDAEVKEEFKSPILHEVSLGATDCCWRAMAGAFGSAKDLNP